MAIAAIKGENLGKRNVTDFLTLSFSAPDRVGHAFGPNSIEQEDVYLRLDREFADLFSFLDEWVGKGSYTVFLTADHGVMDVPEFSQAHRLPGGRLAVDSVYTRIKRRLAAEFGEGDYIRSFGIQLYLNKALMKKKGIALEQIYEAIRDEALHVDGIADVYIIQKLSEATINDYHRRLYMNQINSKRSGDLLISLAPGWITKADFGTSHGTPYNYDTHVPFVIFGWGINAGETLQRTETTDIAPTIAALLHILPPGGSVGHPVEQALTKP
jgi:predicted AlkP superfamily pyrophosphatase or phosphodiesterase